MTRQNIRQQQKSSSQFSPHHVPPIIFTSVSQPSSTTKSPRVASGSKLAQTSYTNSQLAEMEQEFRKNNYLCRPCRISLATPPNVSARLDVVSELEEEEEEESK